MEIISENVSKTYAVKKGLFKHVNIDAVRDFYYEIRQGEIIAFIGEGNSGKSTILKLLSGREIPTGGKIYVDGEENNKKLIEKCQIISNFHSGKLNNESVYNHLLSLGNKLKMSLFDIEKRIVDLKDILEIDSAINKNIRELNCIENAKLNIAIALFNNPSVLLFDEALSEYGVIEKNVILKLLKRVNKEFKTTIILASSDLMDVEKICKRVTYIKNGLIVFDDSYENVKKMYWNEKKVSITFNKSFNVPKGKFEILENGEYYLEVKIDFNKCDFASLINQFDINTIIDINISLINL